MYDLHLKLMTKCKSLCLTSFDKMLTDDWIYSGMQLIDGWDKHHEDIHQHKRY